MWLPDLSHHQRIQWAGSLVPKGTAIDSDRIVSSGNKLADGAIEIGLQTNVRVGVDQEILRLGRSSPQLENIKKQRQGARYLEVANILNSPRKWRYRVDSIVLLKQFLIPTDRNLYQ